MPGNRLKKWIMLLAALTLLSVTAQAADKVVGTRGYYDEIRRPPEPYNGPTRTGKQVYEYRCESCHARTTQGAPMPDDDIEWHLRYQKGVDALMYSVLHGYNKGLMPERGGCRNCTDQELRAALKYMLLQSGINIDAK